MEDTLLDQAESSQSEFTPLSPSLEDRSISSKGDVQRLQERHRGRLRCWDCWWDGMGTSRRSRGIEHSDSRV